MRTNQNHRNQAIACIVFAAILWSADSFLRFRSLERLDPAVVVFFEHLFGLILFTPVLLLKRQVPELPRRAAHLPAWLIVGVGGGALGGIFYTQSLQNTGPSTVNVFQFVQPFFVLLFAFLVLGERRSGNFFQLAVWILLGSAALCLPDFGFGMARTADTSYRTGFAWGLLTAVTWGASTVAGKWLLRHYPPREVVFYRWVLATFSLAIVLLIQGKSLSLAGFTREDLVSLILLSAIVGVFPMWIYYQGLRLLPASVVTLIELLYPLFGVFLPVILRGGRLADLQWAGGAAILLGIAFLVALELGFETHSKKR